MPVQWQTPFRLLKNLRENWKNIQATSKGQPWILHSYGVQDKGMRSLEALMIVADKNEMLIISGNGEVIEPDQDFVAIGSGGNYAYAAANALYNHTDMNAEEIVREALKIASSICVYTNDHISVEKL